MASTDKVDSYDFTLDPSWRIELTHVGDEREPVLVVDGVMRDPVSLVEYAAREVRFQPPARGANFYPGVVGPAPLNYVRDLVTALRPAMADAFGLADAVPARATCNYSIVTAPPAELAPAQRLPHVDSSDPLQFALLHYLCSDQFGGTDFYRHRETGWESLTPERSAAFGDMFEADLIRHPPTEAYIDGDSALYARTGGVEVRFDRLIVYRSRVFHSGRIPPSTPLVADPRRGRLTANVFVNYGRPRHA
jgi:hypothetical protein